MVLCSLYVASKEERLKKESKNTSAIRFIMSHLVAIRCERFEEHEQEEEKRTLSLSLVVHHTDE